MNSKNLFTLVGVVVLFYGIALTFAPNFMGEQYLTNPAWINGGVKLLAQAYGTHLLAYSAACWYVRDAGSSSSSKVMLLLVFLSNLALVIVHTMAILNDVEKSIGWGQVLLSIVLVAWSGMLFRQPTRVVN